VKKQKAFVTLP